MDWILPKFNSLNAFFQTEKCIITSLHVQMSTNFKDILCCFLKDQYIQKTNLAEIDVTDESNFLTENELYLGAGVIGEINKLHAQNGIFSPKQINDLTCEFKKRCRKFLQVACVQIQRR